MSNQSFTFESLPNEVFMDLYEYFDARELYQAFYNLNSRFNSLLQSLSHLSLYFESSNDNLIDPELKFSPQVHTLTIHSQQNLRLHQFSNLHRLTIWFPTDEQILQINAESFPYLEYLSISFNIVKSSIYCLYEKIFSNGFPVLKSCFLCGCDSPTNPIEFKESPNLRYLYITSIYPSMLTACPNLDFLNLSIPSLHDISMDFKPHFNLKRMRLILTSIVWLENERNFEILFLSIPNIEQLSLHKIFSITNSIDLLVDYDWLSGVLTDCLPLLKEFSYYIYILNLFNIDQTDFEKKRPEIEKKFTQIYRNQSSFFLKIKQFNS
jgi:hypothetical protein